MDPVTIYALISGALSSGSSLWNYFSNKSQTSQNNYEQLRNQALGYINDYNNYQQYLENRDYNSPANQMKRFEEAGINPNLANIGNVAMPAFSYNAGEAPRTDFSALNSAREMLQAQVRSVFYDALIKKEQYLALKQNREISFDKWNNYESWIKSAEMAIKENASIRASIEKSGLHGIYDYLFNPDGSNTELANEVFDLVRRNYIESLKAQGYKNSGLIDQHELNVAKESLTEEQRKLVSKKLEEMDEILKSREWSNSDFMRFLQALRMIFSLK